MSATEERTHHWEIIDHDNHQMSGLVAYVVDIWEGDRHDPATSITRYYAVYNGEQLEKEDGEAFDPDFWPEGQGSYSYSLRPKPTPIIWESVDEIKKADRGARTFKSEQERMMDTERYAYGTEGRTRTLYKSFIEAIDILAEQPEDGVAWSAIDAWRDYRALQYEK